MNLLLYLIVVLIWGTTWIAIKFQLGDIPVENSILYRFTIASVLLIGFLFVTKKLKPLTKNDHFFCLLQGGFLFCFNFYAIYKATNYIESGLVSVIFTMSIIFNVFNNWVYYRTLPEKKVIIGSLIGILGIVLVFLPDFLKVEIDIFRLNGIALAMLGTYFFSCGNIITVRHKKHNLKIATTNAWGMLYGAIIMLFINLVNIEGFTVSADPTYLLSLLFLAIPGTILAFAAYLSLINRIGPSKAAYATVLFPLIALSISYYLEGYRPSDLAITGLVLAIIGNIIIFYKPLKTRG